MEFRTQAFLIALAFSPRAFSADLRYDVRWEKLGKDSQGVLAVSETGVSFHETSAKRKKKLFAHEWSYQDIQQLFVDQHDLKLLTYEDVRWRLGADREFHFKLSSTEVFKQVYELLKNRLDQRFVAAIAEPNLQPLWTIPVKRLGRIQGSEGELIVAGDRVVYKTTRPGDSRTWRLEDIENVSSSSAYELVLTTNERARWHYGSMNGVNFRLKQKLDPKRVDDLWLLLQRSQGLKVLADHGRQAQ